MWKFSTLALLLCLPLAAQPAADYPSAVPQWDDVLIAASARSVLYAPISSTETSLVVLDSSAFPDLSANQATLVLVGGVEYVKICGKSGVTLTVCSGGRGFDGTIARAWGSGTPVTVAASPYFHNRLASEVLAIATALGPNLENAGGGGSVITRETDLAPSIDPTSTLEFLSDDFTLTDQGAGVARVSAAAALTRDAEVGALAAAAALTTAGQGAVPKGDLTTGLLNTNWLGTGTPGANTVLLGNQTWAQLAYSQLTGVPSVFPPDTHATAHETGGGDALDLANLAGTLGTGQAASGFVLDSESPAAGDVAGTFAAGLTLGAGSVSADELDEAGVRDSLEAVLVLADMQGDLTESRISDLAHTVDTTKTIQNEGSSLTSRATLNFTGDGVDCADDAGNSRTNCTITGASGGGSGTEILTADWPLTAGLASYVYSKYVTADGTVTLVQCRAPAGVTYKIQIVQREIGIGTSNTFSSAQTCAAGTTTSFTVFSDSAITKADYLELVVSDVTGSPADEDELYVYLEATTPGGTVADDAINTDKLDDGAATPAEGALVTVSTGKEFGYTDQGAGGGLDADTVDGVEAAAFATLAGAETFATGTKTFTAKIDAGGGTLEIPNSTTLPATCVVGESYMDTDATSGQRFYLCESTDTWALQGGGGGGSLTVEEADGTPTGSATTLQFDQADGFTVTDEGSGVFQVDLGDIAAARMQANVRTAIGAGLTAGRIPRTVGGVLVDDDASDAEIWAGGQKRFWVDANGHSNMSLGRFLNLGPPNVSLQGVSNNMILRTPANQYIDFMENNQYIVRFGGPDQTALIQDQIATTGDTLLKVLSGAGESGNCQEWDDDGTGALASVDCETGAFAVASIAIADNTTPSASTDACTAETIWGDGTYLYYCIASGNIGRVAWTTGW